MLRPHSWTGQRGDALPGLHSSWQQAEPVSRGPAWTPVLAPPGTSPKGRRERGHRLETGAGRSPSRRTPTPSDPEAPLAIRPHPFPLRKEKLRPPQETQISRLPPQCSLHAAGASLRVPYPGKPPSPAAPPMTGVQGVRQDGWGKGSQSSALRPRARPGHPAAL